MGFQKALAFVLKWEGGYSNHPKDSGKGTNLGVTQKVFDIYNARRGAPQINVRNITQDEAIDVYRTMFWSEIKGDLISDGGIALAVFDWAVNGGTARAIRHAQEVLRVRADGFMGPVTVAALNSVDKKEFLKAYLQKRRDYYALISKRGGRDVFLKGWLNRVDDLEKTLMLQ